MYLKLGKADHLDKSLNIEFTQINSFLRVSADPDAGELPFAYEYVELNNKFSQINVAAERELFLLDFWKDGVCLANGSTTNITELAKAVDFWLCNDITVKSLADAFRFVQPTEKAAIFEAGKEVEYSWNWLLNDPDPYRKHLKSFVALAVNDDVLSKLFPFTSLNALCFSRCTGYPYTHDTPIVIPVSENMFEVRSVTREVIGYGTAIEALQFVKQNLPLNIGSAVKGTAEDL